MQQVDWQGVFPAITTPFDSDGSVDHAFLAEHARRMVAAGCRGIIPLGSLGEGATLTHAEKVEVVRTLVRAVGDRVPVAPGIAALSTDEAVSLARDVHAAGARGLMVLPPYVYQGDWDEMRAHVSAVISATPLSCMLYNNPIAYGTDFLPEQVRSLAEEHANLHAMKESSGDIRRFTAIKAILGNRITLFVGIDDAIVEGIAAGATGWVAGMVNAMPEESVLLYERAMAGRWAEANALYHWFLPLLRLDVGIKFVQKIKLAQQECGLGNERVRAPRLVLSGTEREMTLAVIRHGIATRPVA